MSTTVQRVIRTWPSCIKHNLPVVYLLFFHDILIVIYGSNLHAAFCSRPADQLVQTRLSVFHFSMMVAGFSSALISASNTVALGFKSNSASAKLVLTVYRVKLVGIGFRFWLSPSFSRGMGKNPYIVKIVIIIFQQ